MCFLILVAASGGGGDGGNDGIVQLSLFSFPLPAPHHIALWQK